MRNPSGCESEGFDDAIRGRLLRAAKHAALRAEIADVLTEPGLRIQETLQRCSESLMRHLPAAFARIWTLNAATQTLELQASAGMYTHLDGPHSRVPVGKFKIGLIAQEAKPHLTNDVLNDRRISNPEWARKEGMVAFAGYPLQIDGRVLGVMALFARETLPDDTLEALSTVAHLVAQGIERKRAEKALRESERRFRAVFNQQFQFMAVLSPEGRLLEINDLPLRIAGGRREDVVGKLFWETPWWQDLPEMKGAWPARLAHAATVDGPVLSEDQYQTAEGSVRVAAAAVTAVKGANGQVECFIIQASDITERKGAEEALRELAERHGRQARLFDSIASSTPDFIYLFDLQGRFLFANRRLLEVWGRKLEDVIGKTCLELGYEQWHHDMHMREIAEVIRTKRAIKGEVPFKARLTGIFGVYEYIFTPVVGPDGGVEVIAGTTRDVTDRKRAEEALRTELGATRTLHNVATRFVRAGEFQTVLQDIVDAAVALTHAAKGNMQLYSSDRPRLRIVAQRGFSESWLAYFKAVDTEQAGACAEALADRKRVIVEDVTASPTFIGTQALDVQLAEGVHAVQSTPILSRSGELLGVLSTHFGAPHRPEERELRHIDLLVRQAADFLEQHRNQQELAEANVKLRKHAEELEARVQERTASLNESLKAFETLLYTIAHDLRAPNRAMQGYAQLLMQGYSERLDEEGRKYLNRISLAAVKNERLIRDLLEFGRLAHVEFPCHALNPKPAIVAVLTGVEREIQATGATIQMAEEWPDVWANDAALTHAFSNLISNALKYVAPGVAPKIDVYPKRLSETIGPSDLGRVRLCVQDNGIGVVADQQERIFEPFQRASSGSYEGTGMGLAIVRKAAERMGGFAGVDSTGQGSCFWIELSLASSKNQTES